MRHLTCVLLVIAFFGSARSQTYEFSKGFWFNGTDFAPARWYSVDGMLTQKQPEKIDSVIDLGGGYVIPPFGEAHNHNVRNYPEFADLSRSYLRSGIFYVKNPNSLNESKAELTTLGLINHPRAIDVIFANGGLTASGGHPSRFFPAASPQGEGNFYHAIDSEQELEKKWPLILAGKPDFVKTFLLYAEEFEKRRNDPRYEGNRGLNPILLKSIVKKAHEANLAVSTHVETARDFHYAVEAGVDEINHLPGFRGDPMRGIKTPQNFESTFLINQEDAQMAGKKGTVVITTIGDFKTIPIFFKLRRAGDRLHRTNLSLLKKVGVKIVVGSDAHEKNSLIEIDYLRRTGVFTNLELIKILCEATPAAIFPDRDIGKFEENFEASFVVLAGNPLKNIRSIRKIKYWVKQGQILDV